MEDVERPRSETSSSKRDNLLGFFGEILQTVSFSARGPPKFKVNEDAYEQEQLKKNESLKHRIDNNGIARIEKDDINKTITETIAGINERYIRPQYVHGKQKEVRILVISTDRESYHKVSIMFYLFLCIYLYTGGVT